MLMGLKNICCFLLQKVFYTVDEFLNYCSQIKSNCLFRFVTTDRVYFRISHNGGDACAGCILSGSIVLFIE